MSEPDNDRRRPPTGLRQLDTVEELSTFPDGTVVIWYSPNFPEPDRQAGVLDTDSDGDRTIRPISVRVYESNTDLRDVTAPLWVLTFDDPPGVDLFSTLGIHATLQGRGWGPPWSGPAANASRMIQDRFAD